MGTMLSHTPAVLPQLKTPLKNTGPKPRPQYWGYNDDSIRQWDVQNERLNNRKNGVKTNKTAKPYWKAFLEKQPEYQMARKIKNKDLRTIMLNDLEKTARGEVKYNLPDGKGEPRNIDAASFSPEIRKRINIDIQDRIRDKMWNLDEIFAEVKLESPGTFNEHGMRVYMGNEGRAAKERFKKEWPDEPPVTINSRDTEDKVFSKFRRKKGKGSSGFKPADKNALAEVKAFKEEWVKKHGKDPEGYNRGRGRGKY